MMKNAEHQGAFYRLLAKLVDVMLDIYAIVLTIQLSLNRYLFLFLLLMITTSDTYIVVQVFGQDAD